MKKIPEERKGAILTKRRGPDRKPMATNAAENGARRAIFYNWRKLAREEVRLLPDHHDSPEGWSSRDKFNAVLETAALSKAKVYEYCWRHRLYLEQIGHGSEVYAQANDFDASRRSRGVRS